MLPGVSVNVQLCGDNNASLFITEGEANLRKVRHLELADLYCRIVAERDNWNVASVRSSENVADLGTKILDAPAIRRLLALAGVGPCV